MNTLQATMRKKAWCAFQLGAGILACWVLSPMATAGDPPKAALVELRAVVTSIIQLLEKQQYEELFWRYADPEVVKKTKETGTIGGDSVPEWAEQFAADKGPRLLDALRSIKDDQPVFDERGIEATYEVGRPVLGSKTAIVFIKHKKGWHLRNY